MNADDQCLTALSVQSVSKSFGQTCAVKKVSFDVMRGEFFVLVGGSGSGKTTTLKLLNRLVAADAGLILLNGAPHDEKPAHELRRHIGYVFQGVGLFPHLTVAENIAVTPQLLGWPREVVDARVAELLELVEMPAALFRQRFPGALSGGQRQRVGFARALAARPEIILMDEPFGALDSITRNTIAQAYWALHDKLGLTTVMVTHDVQEALLLADRIGVMRDGELLAIGTPAALLNESGYVGELLAAPCRQAEQIARKFEEMALSSHG